MARLIFTVGFLFLWNFLNITVSQPFEFKNVVDIDFKSENISYRLPNNTRPESYNVYISTDVANNNFGFSGAVDISINVQSKTNEITVHQRQLNIISVDLVEASGQNISTLPPQYDPITEFLTIKTVNRTLSQGTKVYLTIKYNGTLNQGATGFYRTSLYDSNNKLRWFATTHFEPTYARHAFPCYDEPAFKATFNISIEHNSAYMAISNMPLINQTVKESRTISKFDQTPLMSTYLIAFVVSDFPFKGKVDRYGLKHRVFAKPTEIESAYFAVDKSVEILNAFSDYLQVNYSLPKMDQIAVPQLYFGAMENWGLVTYLEKFLLYDANKHSYKRKFNVVNLIAHEYSHQWFENLVSPKWWNFVWLNEGFATLFENIGTDLVHPEFNAFEIFITNELQRVLKTNAKSTGTRPMTHYLENPQAVANLFDEIAYAKSGSVLRMFMHAFGEKSFKKGLNYYLNKKSYKAAIDEDLFESLDRAVKEDNSLDSNLHVHEIFSSWSNQAGFPLLIVNRNYEENSMEISQERYFDKYPHPSANLSTWYIPYNFDTSNNVAVNNTTPNGWLPSGVQSMVIKSSKSQNWTSQDWVLFNKQQTGFYRVLYDVKNYRLIMNELHSGDVNKIHPLSRAQLLDDLNDFVLTHRLPVKMYFDFIQYLKRETEYAPWSSALRSLLKIKNALKEGSDVYSKFVKSVADIVEPFYQRNALTDANENEPLVKNLLREVAVKLACGFKIESCLRDAEQLLEMAIHSGHFPSKNTRGLIYFYGIHKANVSFIDLVRKRVYSTNNDEERDEIWHSLNNLEDSKSIVGEQLNDSFGSNTALNHNDRLTLLTDSQIKSQYELLQAMKLLENEFDEGCTLNNDHVYKRIDLDKTLLTLSRNVYTDYAKDQFLFVLTTLEKRQCISNESSKVIISEMNRTLEESKSIRKLIGEYMSALP